MSPSDNLPGSERRRYRVLYIHPGPVPPQMPAERNPCYHLSKYLDGDLVTISWDSRERYRNNRSEYERALGGFGYHPSLSRAVNPGLLRAVWQFGFFVFRSLWLTARSGRYDAIVAYAPFKTAWAGVIVKLLTRSPLIVQIPGNPNYIQASSRRVSVKARRALQRIALPTLLRVVDHLHVLYPRQVDLLASRHVPSATAFADFTATSLVPVEDEAEDYILFLGYPWHLKGVDVLIRAFNEVSSRFPSVQLKIVGHCEDRAPFIRLAGDNKQIEFCSAVMHDKAMQLMSRCRFFVLPSRSEGMGRVILEAWAAGKAVVASDADGIPHLVRNGVDGLLFPTQNVDALAEKLATLLGRPEEAQRLGKNGLKRIQSEFGEDRYARSFCGMVAQVADSRAANPR